MDTDDLNDPTLMRAGDAVARLSRPQAPAGLAARTLARISERLPVKKVFWMLRPITHPIARIAAAALIIYALAPLTDMDIASRLGSQIEQHVIGRTLGDHVEAFVDGVLIQHYTSDETQGYAPSHSYGRNLTTDHPHVRPMHTRVGT